MKSFLKGSNNASRFFKSKAKHVVEATMGVTNAIVDNTKNLLTTPTPPKEQVAGYWKEIKHDYENDGIVKNNLITSMINIIIEELQNSGPDEIGSCAEFLITEKMLLVLAEMASRREPPGILVFILDIFTDLINLMHPGLLNHPAIYNALYVIFIVAIPEKKLLLNLIDILISKFKTNSSLSKLFLQEIKQDDLDVRPCSIFEILGLIYKDNDPYTQREVKKILLSCVRVASDISVISVKGIELNEVLVGELFDLIKSLPQKIVGNNLNMMIKIFSHLDYCNLVCAGSRFAAFQNEMKKLIANRITSEILSSFFSSDKQIVNTIIVYYREIILHLGSRSPLTDLFIHALFQQQESGSVINKLLSLILYRNLKNEGESNLQCQDIQLSTNTLRFLSTLFDCIEHGDVFDFMNEYISKLEDNLLPINERNEAIEKFSRLFFTMKSAPRPESLSSSPNMNTESDHLNQSQDQDPAYNLIMIKRSPTYQESMISVKRRQQKLKLLAKYNALENQNSQEGRTETNELYPILFKALENFYKNEFEYNLFLTELVLKMIQIPSLEMLKFFLQDKDQQNKKTNLSLYRTLNNLVDKASLFSEKEILEASIRINSYAKGPWNKFNEATQIQQLDAAVIALEFAKEVTASLLAVHSAFEDKRKDKQIIL